MLWHLIKSLSALLSKPFKDARKEFMKALTGAHHKLSQFIIIIIVIIYLLNKK